MKYLQISTLSLIILLVIHTISESNYFLFDFEAYQKDSIFLISILIIAFNIKYIKQIYDPKDKYIYIFAIYSFIASIIMALFNFNQPVVYSMFASRILLIIMTLYIAVIFLLKNITEVTLYRLTFTIAMFLILFNFYLYFSGNLSILYIDTTYAFRLGEIRLTIASQSVIVLLLFFYFHSKEKALSYIPFLGLLAVLIIVDKTRASIIAILIILFLSMLNIKDVKTLRNWLVVIFIILFSSLIGGFESSLISPLTDIYYATQNEVQKGAGNVNVRAMELAYFWNRLDFYSMIFGYGMDNHQFKFLYYKHFYLSDLGIFKVFYLHGAIGLLFFGGIYLAMYREASKGISAIHKTGQALVLFQVLSPTLNFTYSIQGMLMFFVLYILIKKLNNKDKLYG